MKRRKARENVIIVLFEASFNINSYEEIVNFANENEEFKFDDFSKKLLDFYCNNTMQVDALITENLKDWSISRLPRVNTAILRAAVSEMLSSEEDMDSIVINEAVEIAKKYAGDNDFQFINGVLGSVSKKLRADNVNVSNGEN